MSGVVSAVAVALSISYAMAVVVLVSAVVMVAAIAYSVYMMSTMKKPGSFSSARSLRDRTQVVRSAVEPRQYIYGQVMVSGPLIYTYTNGPNLYLVVALAGHEVESIGDVYLGDKLYTDPVFEGLVQVTKYLGTPNQAADLELIGTTGGQWTANHRLRGVAYIIVRLTYDSKSFPSGIPNIKAVVTGNNQIYDPRTGTTGYTNNWALCIYDYLTKEYGIGCDVSEINAAQAIAAANICDEDVTLASGGTEKRYTMNGTFNADQKPLEIMKKMLTAALGNVVWSQGQYYINPAAYRLPESYIITESDLAGPLGVQPAKSGKDKFNTVRGVFADPTEYWQPVDFPPQVNSTALALDGRELAHDIELLYTTSSAAAQRLAKIHLERELQGIVVTFQGKLTLFGLKPGDVVALTISSMGWIEKEFRVVTWQMGEQGGINLTLREESDSVYDWNSGMETTVDPAPNTLLPDPFTVQPPASIAVSDDIIITGGAAVARMIIDITASPDVYISRYDVDVRASGETEWLSISTSQLTRSTLVGVNAGDGYDVRARAYNMLGVSSDYIGTYHVVGTSASTPEAVTGLVASISNVAYDMSFQQVITVTWDAVAIPYHSSVEIQITTGAVSTVVSMPPQSTLYQLPTSTPGVEYIIKARTRTSAGNAAIDWSSISSVSITTASATEYNPWRQLQGTSDAYPVGKCTLTHCGGALYRIGGNTGSADVATVKKYDLATKTWANMTSAPVAMSGHTAVEIGGKIYTYLGTTCLEYDPGLDVWTTKATGPNKTGHAAVAIGNKMYVAQGNDSSTGEYDPVANTWATKATQSLPMNGGQGQGAVYNDMMLVSGNSAIKGYLSAYDPVTNSWAYFWGSTEYRFVSNHPAAVYGDRYYMPGEAYTPVLTDNISSEYNVPPVWIRNDITCCLVGNMIYVVGGYTNEVWSCHVVQ